MPPSPTPFPVSISRYMTVRRYSQRTFDAYFYWIKYFIMNYSGQTTSDIGEARQCIHDDETSGLTY